MSILLLLLVPACLGAPPADPATHVHASGACTKTYCRVSNNTLDSALETFLCMKKNDIKGLREKEKKLVLAQKIAPLLKMEDGSSVEEILGKMDTARLVPIVNLVLHDRDGDAAVEAKTELEYTLAVREGLSSITSLHPTLFRRASPLVLGILNCQAKLLTKLYSIVLVSQRNGRALPGAQYFLAKLGTKLRPMMDLLKSELNIQNKPEIEDLEVDLDLDLDLEVDLETAEQ